MAPPFTAVKARFLTTTRGNAIMEKPNSINLIPPPTSSFPTSPFSTISQTASQPQATPQSAMSPSDLPCSTLPYSIRIARGVQCYRDPLLSEAKTSRSAPRPIPSPFISSPPIPDTHKDSQNKIHPSIHASSPSRSAFRPRFPFPKHAVQISQIVHTYLGR